MSSGCFSIILGAAGAIGLHLQAGLAWAPAEIFSGYFDNPDPQTQLESVIAVGEIGRPEALALLSGILDDTGLPYFPSERGRLVSGTHRNGSLVQPDRLRARILLWAEEETRVGALPARSGSILESVLYRGELPRGEADTVVGRDERQARRFVSALVDKSVLVSDHPRAPARLVFPATLASRWMPGLFPERAA